MIFRLLKNKVSDLALGTSDRIWHFPRPEEKYTRHYPPPPTVQLSTTTASYQLLIGFSLAVVERGSITAGWRVQKGFGLMPEERGR